jgi:hypothetical protein
MHRRAYTLIEAIVIIVGKHYSFDVYGHRNIISVGPNPEGMER